MYTDNMSVTSMACQIHKHGKLNVQAKQAKCTSTASQMHKHNKPNAQAKSQMNKHKPNAQAWQAKCTNTASQMHKPCVLNSLTSMIYTSACGLKSFSGGSFPSPHTISPPSFTAIFTYPSTF